MMADRTMRLVKSPVGLGAGTAAAAAGIFLVNMVATAHPSRPTAPATPSARIKSVDREGALVSPLVRPPSLVRASEIIRHADPGKLFLRSEMALIMDERERALLYARNIDEPRPIASLTKLMTAMVIRDARLPLDETIRVTRADRDRLRGSTSRLRYGTVATRLDLLRAALAASDNRAAAALARTYPGGREALVRAMNDKARQLGMTRTRFTGPAGLDSGNRSTARDLAKLVYAARSYPLMGELSTSRSFRVVDQRTRAKIGFRNTNYLVRKNSWRIQLSKTGYTSDAGNCLVMRTTIATRPLILVLLNSWGRLSKFGDSNRIRKWLLTTERKVRTLRDTPKTRGD